MTSVGAQRIREAFAAATNMFEDTARAIGENQLGQPGLGEWTVLELLAHTCRAFLTIEQTLNAVDEQAPVLPDTVTYFRVALDQNPAIHAQIAVRAAETVPALGAQPLTGALDIAGRGRAVVDTTPDDAPVAHFTGRMRFIDYLPSRIVELVLHTLDLQQATRQPLRAAPDALAITLSIVTALADRADPIALALAMTGRADLPHGFNVLR
ncbi:MAG: maleylpyruvate isomerase N-terminal domain-containing protein [Acidimicrobiales bacterium]